jgi:hypothetical protein
MPNLQNLYVYENYLTHFPTNNFANLINIDVSNQHGHLTYISDFFFEKFQATSAPCNLLKLNLEQNLDLKFAPRSFCLKKTLAKTNQDFCHQARVSNNKYLDLTISNSTLVNLDKCVFKELALGFSGRIRIFVNRDEHKSHQTERQTIQQQPYSANDFVCSCAFRLFLARYNVLIKGFHCPLFKSYCADQVEVEDDCDDAIYDCRE